MTRIESDRRFEVDAVGFRGHVKKLKPHQIIQEIISNSFDEDSVKNVICEIEFNQEKRQVVVKINNDGIPFRDVEEIFTLYKHSYKRNKPEKRGRFNLGDKQFFAVAITGHVITGDKIVEFTETKRIVEDHELFTGVEVVGYFKWGATVLNPTIRELYKIIVPQDKRLVINGKEVQKKNLVKVIQGVLRTEMENEDNVMEEFDRKTNIELYNKQPNEDAMVFELGIPVQKLEDNIEWHINVMQKIPLRTDRDVVTEAYLKRLYGVVINQANELLTEDNAGSGFVQMGLIHADAATAKTVFQKALGTDKVFIESTVDGRANDSVKEIGGITLKSGFLDKDVRNHLKDLGVLQSATEVFGAKGIETLSPFEETEGMRMTVKLTKYIAREILGKKINCIVVHTDNPHNADYGSNQLRWNVRLLGKSFFDKVTKEMVRIIIHELSHDAQNEDCTMSSHYSTSFVSELQRVGAAIAIKGIDYFIRQAGLPESFGPSGQIINNSGMGQ